MKRYIIFVAIGPFLGGFLLLLATTVMSGYWVETHPHEVGKLIVVFFKSLPYNYLFGFIPVMAFAAIDDILSHVHRINAVVRMLIVGVIAFFGSAWLYGFQGGGEPDAKQFILFGLGGSIPSMLSSWLSHKVVPAPAPVASAK